MTEEKRIHAFLQNPNYKRADKGILNIPLPYCKWR